MKRIFYITLTAIILTACNNFSKTSQYDLSVQKGWDDLMKDLPSHIDKNAMVNQIEFDYNEDKSLKHFIIDCQNPDSKYNTYLKRSSYKKTDMGYTWNLLEGNSLYLKDENDSMIKDIKPFLTSINEIDIAKLGKVYLEALPKLQSKAVQKMSFNFAKDKTQQFIEIEYTDKEGSSQTVQMTFEGKIVE